jgi:hypothetical protein
MTAPSRLLASIVSLAIALVTTLNLSACDNWGHAVPYYQVSTSGDGMRAYVVDEQTGEVRFCSVAATDRDYGCDVLPSPSIPDETPSPESTK